MQLIIDHNSKGSHAKFTARKIWIALDNGEEYVLRQDGSHLRLDAQDRQLVISPVSTNAVTITSKD